MNEENTYTSSCAIRFKEPLTFNFDVSIIMPFYKKLKEFKLIFPRNKDYFQRNGIEIVLVLDCQDEKEELIEYIKGFPFINCKIIYNDKQHAWRNPAKPINVGIKHASKKYIMVCSPESEFFTDAIYQLRSALEYYPKHYAIGTVCFANEGDIITSGNIKNIDFKPFGSIMVEKKYLYEIEGYDEVLDKWGGDDNNIRSRLDYVDVKQLFLPEVILIHRDIDNEEGKIRRAKTVDNFNIDAVKHFFYPTCSTPNNGVWGTEFNNIIYDWSNNVYSNFLLCKYLHIFEICNLKKNATFNKYKMLLLVQTYNEEKNIQEFLDKVSSNFDGIILLDDGSEDSTYEVASHKKLLLKVKQRRAGFNDLLNRNTLIELATFFNYNWACFLDVDEELDDKFNNLQELIIKYPEADSFLFNLIQLWDNHDTYNCEYPSTINGVALRLRMFKNMGYAKIFSDRGKLHFVPIPYIGKTYHVPILIKHYGNLTKEDRMKKYAFYINEDKERSQVSYEHLLTINPQLKNVSDITVNDLLNASKLIKL